MQICKHFLEKELNLETEKDKQQKILRFVEFFLGECLRIVENVKLLWYASGVLLKLSLLP